MTLSLAEIVDEKDGTTILERVAFLLRLSIYYSNVNSRDTDSNKAFAFLLNPICIVVVL